MIEISEDRLDNFILRIKAIIKSKDYEIKDCALISLVEELEELKLIGDR
jgi:hypothetical protein